MRRARPPARLSPMTTLRLILGDQLNPLHSWFATVRADVVYTLMEVRQETDYVHSITSPSTTPPTPTPSRATSAC